ncbi:MAG TPA: F0F1 ATP synthase subunit alpha [Candidatus Gemmiger avistercoris]|uniref:Multifunctional fusion protein n=1 Tax=Candidatus Gemmiger avistercoris TaxID=2838606 RepID=A0A9D2FIE5_9FIRM|nr:F0F1 ATP synthase subunit alpha [uncultured Subdoligranulum sp.]HIZ61819.1 F0F1 ATP synthase subunit alpha [Candidatus Gemmiger avistercoris]
MSETTQRYAAALFGAAGHDAKAVRAAAEALMADQPLWTALQSRAVTLTEKKQLIRDAAELDGQEALKTFLGLAAEADALGELPAILAEYSRLALAAQGGVECRVTCARQPDEATQEAIRQAVCKLRGARNAVLEIRIDPAILGGFVLDVDGVTYDRSVKGRLDRLARGMQDAPDSGDMDRLADQMKAAIAGNTDEVDAVETGRVLSVGDGIANVSGLRRAVYGELVEFENGTPGIVLDLRRSRTGVILLGSQEGLTEGSLCRRTGRPADVPVGDALVGRTVNALGQPIDGLGPIETSERLPIEHEASGVISREPVNQPMQTGILAIDAMVPIGRGQRELIIGDRQTGKTAIAVDAILNQKGQDMICIYVAIGQKESTVARLRETFRQYGAMAYTIIVSAPAGEGAPMQYIAPYAGAAMGEYFMAHGKDVLIVYDDLSKHAVAYRTLSLLLRRSPGREAYPGDVFYLHSRLLERACRLTKEYGGGSMTALPIVETQAGDVSAYIPTNVISITDGQIYLETNLFHSGQRPAVNVGLSVSRVGGSAQTRAIKKTAGTLRIDLARYRELEVFTQFSSDLDPETRKALDHGKRMMALLRQPRCTPMAVSRQAVILYIATNGLLADVPVEEVSRFANAFVDLLEREQPALIGEIDETGALSGTATEQIRTTLDSYKKQVSAQWKA